MLKQWKMAIKLWTCRCGSLHGEEYEGDPCLKCRTEVINIGAVPPVYHKKLSRKELDQSLKRRNGKKVFKSFPFSLNCGMSSIIIIFVKQCINNV